MGWKRRAMISLALGAVTTVAVAWWPVLKELWDKQGYAGRTSTQRPAMVHVLIERPEWKNGRLQWTISRGEHALLSSVFIHVTAASNSRTTPVADDEIQKFAALGPELGDLASELRLDRGEAVPNAKGLLASIKPGVVEGYWWAGWGWPLRAMTFQSLDQHPRLGIASLQEGWVIRSAFTSTSPNMMGFYPPLILPLRPIWSGFGLDTVLFATFWIALLNCASWFRSVRRGRQARCRECAYDRKGLALDVPCPECGKQSIETDPGTPHAPDPALPARQL